jgi:hypothetical protein
LLKLGFEGFEQVERLLPVLVLAGGEVVDAAVADEVLRAPMQAGEASKVQVEDAVMDDAVEEQLFLVQREVDVGEHVRFEQASWQADRFLEDRLLVLRRRRAEANVTLEQASRTSENAQGAQARTAAEQGVARAQARLDELDAAMARLADREDTTFQRHQAHNERRRYAAPTREVLADVALRFEPPTAKKKSNHGQ